MRDVVLEVRRTMNGWIVEYPGGEDCFNDGTRRGFSLSTIQTDVRYDFEEQDGSLLIHVHRPPVNVPTTSVEGEGQ